MAKATALAPSNIAFIKYWGKRDVRLNLPVNGSVSMNLSRLQTITTVEFGDDKKDRVVFDGRNVKSRFYKRVVSHLDRVRKLAGISLRARVATENTFPFGVGIASSASGFAALTLAAASAAGLSLSERELSVLGRRGSGSAARSIPDGYVEWVAGTQDADSYAYSFYPPEYWDICDVVVMVSKRQKAVGSTQGHALARTSPFFRARVRGLPAKLVRLKEALKEKDFSTFGAIVEAEALNMHGVMLTSSPALVYWEPATITVMQRVWLLREGGLESYVTLDAGPTVHVICQKLNARELSRKLSSVRGVVDVVVNRPVDGARIVKKHLF